MGKADFCAPGNDYNLAEVMNRLLNDTDLRSRLATGTQEHVRQFTASAVVERLEAVYAQVDLRNSETSLKRCLTRPLIDYDT